MITGMLVAPLSIFTGKIKWKMHLEGQKGFKTPQKVLMAAQHMPTEKSAGTMCPPAPLGLNAQA